MSAGRIIVILLVAVAVIVLLGLLFGVDLGGSGGADPGPVGGY
jgi:hypothetical protein